VRWILGLLRGVAAAAALVLLVLALIHAARVAWVLWVDQLAGTAAPLVIGACTGHAAIRALIGLRAGVIRWRRRWRAARALPLARVVSR
jgi:hypothetical protein